jgi:hypothetical protein
MSEPCLNVSVPSCEAFLTYQQFLDLYAGVRYSAKAGYGSEGEVETQWFAVCPDGWKEDFQRDIAGLPQADSFVQDLD